MSKWITAGAVIAAGFLVVAALTAAQTTADGPVRWIVTGGIAAVSTTAALVIRRIVRRRRTRRR